MDWYGWQNLTVDGASLVLLGTALALSQSSAEDELQPAWATLLIVGLFSFPLASPIVHFAHGNVGLGFASIGLRVLGAAVTAAGYLAVGFGRDGGGAVMVLGALMLIGVIAMDAVLGRERKAQAPPSAVLLPDLMLRADGAALTLRGRF